MDWTKSVRRRESESFFLLIRLLPGTGLACSALGEALPLSCQRFWAAKVLKRKEKIPNWICEKLSQSPTSRVFYKIKQDFTFCGFCCGILIATARYRLGWRRVSVSSGKKNNQEYNIDEATKLEV